ncbi:2-oxoacid:acceptor oxidoreductase subunit alpha [Candidatus Roizmanbacteria bacterium CG_4_10_14_0_2_um_filter_36_35]|uniref:2-oxoacid:acceptor oxidoreductase subunit alpha n=4 Tax=Candidatus Roizmaniibacteriota TaxID=1752723 RepID=A0A2M7BX34_9BACT|nr:MAG: 2-oxoacid:ferredoxin oxidoreductase subunit alpha [Candidatus Roizmanbacteria bacterium CG11_big_fil_rev_8_21_14_0_20_35_14]PIV11118.1 MAG: 2-oxoacid:acceptor oxidoreductase subunit alpha [Candidatus Roizmanbacteria bacterium CG03_land_8_20_14_0_80_35_26]PIZ68525.1 MAG: 2-oxoacid:acceptor oxidoreductase subunit alpha [Candidatus Roizmanbacteria bacterium CG_4_10_14_0_2_um_filter_36_35]PJC31795.1 MAG: 2-oxoacid:acceptor oxidoreductase subunit alpha [Candidatus Roizmanbacteria bacterium CG
MSFTWKIGGEAGFGIMTTGLLFSKIASRSGYHIFDYVEYPSLIRGGHNAYEVHVSENETTHLNKTIEILVCLNKETFEKHKFRLTSESLVIYDKDEFGIISDYKTINIPFKKILSELKGQPVMKNTIALGASIAVLGGDIDVLLKIIEEQFSKKGEEIINFNKQFANVGFNQVKNNYKTLILNYLTKRKSDVKLVMTGNDAFSLGSMIADCRLYVAYPMTPASSVLTTLASWQKKTNIVVRHAEDEISVINTAIGASFAGVRSSVGTSGGGFALMVETVSLAGVTEIPLVIFVSQRPGPATGMPTWTEQGDLLFAVHSGHGEFPKIVLAPGDIEEMIELTAKAYNLADIYQLPVIVMSDMLLSESHKTVSKKFVDDFIAEYKVNRGKISNIKASTFAKASVDEQNFLRYKITEDGISERLIPETPGSFYQANSYEHLEDGHTTEESAPRIAQVDKRARKWQTYLKSDFQLPKIYGDIDKADVVFVCWGSTKGVVVEEQKILLKKDKASACIHFNHMYPLDKEKIKGIFNKKKRYILVENNSWGQFGKLLLQETGIEIKEKLLKYDGRPIMAEEIINKLT